jgi:hypothetical protein
MKYIVQVGVMLPGHTSIYFIVARVKAYFVIYSPCMRALQRRRIEPKQRRSSRYVLTGSVYTDRDEHGHSFQDKNVSKYNQALAQALDGISSKAAFIKVRRNGQTTTLLAVS